MRWSFYSPGLLSLEVLQGNTKATGGAESQIAYLALTLASRGHDVRLLYGSGYMAAEPQTIQGVRCFDVVPTWRRPRSFKAFYQALHAQTDIFYARLPDDFLPLAYAISRRQGARCIYAIANERHCVPRRAFDHKSWLHAPFHAASLNSADIIAIQHENQRALLAPNLRRKAHVVPNLRLSAAENPRDFASTDFDVVWIAKIRPMKRLDICLDAAEKLEKLQFAIVGGFDPTIPQDQVNYFKQKMNNISNLQYLGPMNSSDVVATIARSKVLINTSDEEGFPNTMLEAWSVGVPVVSLRVDPGGIIARQGTGSACGSVENFCQEIQRLVEQEELNKASGANGISYVRRRHSIEALQAGLSPIGIEI